MKVIKAILLLGLAVILAGCAAQPRAISVQNTRDSVEKHQAIAVYYTPSGTNRVGDQRSAAVLAFALLILAAGALDAFHPRLAWQLADGRKLQNAEPSGLYLAFLRTGGVVMMEVGTFLLIRGG